MCDDHGLLHQTTRSPLTIIPRKHRERPQLTRLRNDQSCTLRRVGKPQVMPETQCRAELKLLKQTALYSVHARSSDCGGLTDLLQLNLEGCHRVKGNLLELSKLNRATYINLRGCRRITGDFIHQNTPLEYCEKCAQHFELGFSYR